MALFGRQMLRGIAAPTVGVGAGIPDAAPPSLGGVNYKPEELKPGGGGQVRSSGGLFGQAFGRKNLPRTLQVIGATLQQMDNPQGRALDYLQANEADAARQAAADAATSRAQKLQDDQRAQFEQAISALPPEQQRWARLNPEAFAEAMMRAQVGGGWQHGQGYSNLWRPNPDGTVTLGDPLPLRPRSYTPYATDPSADDWEEY